MQETTTRDAGYLMELYMQPTDLEKVRQHVVSSIAGITTQKLTDATSIEPQKIHQILRKLLTQERISIDETNPSATRYYGRPESCPICGDTQSYCRCYADPEDVQVLRVVNSRHD